MKHKILIVDDESGNLRLLTRLFRAEYEVLTAESGIEALELLDVHDVALIISDQRMPGMTGIDFLKRSAEVRIHTLRILLTGYTDASALVEAINSGVIYKYITKPWVNEDLQQTVRRALQHYETIKNQHQLWLQGQRLKGQLKSSSVNFAMMVSEIVGLKDPYSSGHARRTSEYAVSIARCLNLDDQQVDQLRVAALLHEVARIGIPDEIIFKSDALTEKELETMIWNYDNAVGVLGSVEDFEEAARVLRYQHEHFDGSGFPERLSGEEIPLASRILAVANAYDEMAEPRPLKPTFSHQEAIEYLMSECGMKFDPAVVEAFSDLQSGEMVGIIPEINCALPADLNQLNP
ncbi:MAG: HD-GYP domain-containing protein [Blastocatellia bacterium]